MKNKVLVFAGLACLAVIAFISYKSINRDDNVFCPEDVKICSDGAALSRSGHSCEFTACPLENEIIINSPRTFGIVKNPLTVIGSARGGWYFEASFPVKVVDSNGNIIGEAPAQAESDWMTENFVPFNVTLNFETPGTKEGFIILQKNNPSGLPENQRELRMPIAFKEQVSAQMRKVKLYYYNTEKDEDASGNIKCSKDGLVAIEREIPISISPIKETIELLLKGKQNLSQNDIAAGISTEYPLSGFSLLEANLKSDGTLILKFDDLENKSGGGSCRVGILSFQIETTARQFPEVKSVRFLPEELFQP